MFQKKVLANQQAILALYWYESIHVMYIKMMPYLETGSRKKIFTSSTQSNLLSVGASVPAVITSCET